MKFSNVQSRLKESLWKTEERLFAALKRMNMDVDDRTTASTGTKYITIGCEPQEPFIIRIANHRTAYASEDYSISPEEGSFTGAIEALTKYCGKPVPSWVSSVRTRQAKSIQKREDERKERKSKYRQEWESQKKQINNQFDKLTPERQQKIHDEIGKFNLLHGQSRKHQRSKINNLVKRYGLDGWPTI